MKIEETPVNIERSGEMLESSFGISKGNESHILNILRDKLYSDKIGAIVREYATNALDSHVEAGKSDVPIRIKLPSKLDPTFSIIDDGIGLSEEDVRNIYVQYGASTKRNSNQVIGQLGLGCLLAGESITTLEGMKPVEQIKVEDIVLTHKGNWKRVYNVMSRRHTGDAYKIYLSGKKKPTLVTDEHPILIANSKGETEWKLPGQILDGYKSKKKGIKNWNSYAVLPHNLESNFKAINLDKYLPEHIKFIDDILTSETSWKQNNHSSKEKFENHRTYKWSNFPLKISATHENGWLLGLWAAEGSAGEKELNLTLNINENDLAERFRKGMKKLFNVNFKIYKREERNSQELIATCVPLASILTKMCGHLAQNKKVPVEVMLSNKEMRCGFLEGVLDGDGSSTRDKFTFGVASSNLAWGVRTLMAEAGHWNSVGYMDSPGTKEGTNPRWSVNFNKNPDYSYHFQSKDYLCRSIKRIEKVKLDSQVYNFSVEDDESYVSDFVLHNCKCAFAYTDNFNIVARKDGKKKTFSAYLDESKCGKVALLFEEETTENDGVEIQIPVKPQDIHSFESKVKTKLRFMTPMPEVNGEILEGEPFYELETIVNGKRIGTHNNNNSHVVMGSIAYPFDFYEIYDNSNVSVDVREKISALRNKKYDIYVSIGEVDISANREALEYTAKTCTTIANSLIGLTDKVIEKIKKDIDDCKTLKEAKEYWNNKRYILNEYKCNHLKWNGHILNQYLMNNNIEFADELVDENNDGNFVPRKFRCTITSMNIYHNRNNYQVSWNIYMPSKGVNTLFFNLDNTSGWKSKASKWIRQNNYIYKGITYSNFVGVQFPDDETKNRFFKHWRLEEYQWVNLSDLKLEKTTRSSTSGSNSNSHYGKMFTLKDTNLRNNKILSLNWERIQGEVGNGLKYYVELDRFKIVNSRLTVTCLDDLLNLLKLKGININKCDVIGIKSANIKQKHPGWIPLLKFATKILKNDKTIKRWTEIEENLKSSRWKQMEFIIPYLERIKDKKGFFYTQMKAIEKKQQERKKYEQETTLSLNDIRNIFFYLSIPFYNDDSNYTPTIDNFYKRIQKEYPVLEFGELFPKSNSWRMTNRQAAENSIKYINMHDLHNKTERQRNDLSLYSKRKLRNTNDRRKTKNCTKRRRQL